MIQRKAAKSAKPAKSKTVLVGRGVGRRKKSIARVWLHRGSGKVTVNNRTLDTYFDTDVMRSAAVAPFRACPEASAYDVRVNVQGGGKVGQADAVKLGFARALLQTNEALRSKLRQHGLLTVDSRVKERKKPGQPGARRKFQFVKR